MDNLDYSVDAAGNVYIITRVFNDDTTDQKKRGDDKANYKLEILKVTTGGRKTTSAKVDVADKFILNVEHGGWSRAQSDAVLKLMAGLYNGRIDLSSLRG